MLSECILLSTLYCIWIRVWTYFPQQQECSLTVQQRNDVMPHSLHPSLLHLVLFLHKSSAYVTSILYFCHFSRFSSHYFSPSCSFLCFVFFLSSPFWSLLCFLSLWPISLALAPLITVLWAWPARRPAWLPFFIIASNWIREGSRSRQYAAID